MTNVGVGPGFRVLDQPIFRRSAARSAMRFFSPSILDGAALFVAMGLDALVRHP